MRVHSRESAVVAAVLLSVAPLVAASSGSRPEGDAGLARDLEGGSESALLARKARALLSDRCFACHGPDEAARKAGLRLDLDPAAATTRDGRPAVLGPSGGVSELVARITSTDADERMPPPSSKLALDEDEIELLRRWVATGAPYERHWAFAAPRRHAAPVLADDDWSRDPLDRFVFARARERGLSPRPDAARETWLRRVTFDLTGLPPTLAELDAFLADERADAFERVVDRLLASPRYGERMASDWLDVARYADTYGYQADVGRDVWPWRDWVIDAFDANVPWDRFVTLQLAGDLVPDATREDRLATAFNRLHRQTNEGGSVEEEFRVEYVVDRVNTVGTALLGLTLECARCHDHKFDPISQREYYRLSAFFDDVDESGLYSHFTNAVPTPALDLPTEEEERALAAHREAIAAAEGELRAAEARAAGADAPTAELGVSLASGLQAAFAFESIADDGALVDAANAERPGRTADAPTLTDGRIGRALALDGEDNAHFPGVGAFHRSDPFTLSLWLRTAPERAHVERAVVLHRSKAWTDSGSQGYELLLEDGRVSAALIHFWPGNALRVRTRRPIAAGEWTHVAVVYDGSSRASGLRLFVDGDEADVEVVRDALTRGIDRSGEVHLTLGQRFRDRGFAGGAIDELVVHARELTLAEVRHLAAGRGVTAPVERSAGERASDAVRFAPEVVAAREALRVARRARDDAFDGVRAIMTMSALDEPRTAYVLHRGSYLERRDPVEPGVPAVLGAFPEELERDRLGFARWLTAAEHPLFARVAVNRLWQIVFGRGLVATPEDFGTQGVAPVHQELLDTLALDFVASGWDVKGLVRRLVLSSTYRQGSRAPAADVALDPGNDLLARSSVRRLSAEMLRDSVLAVSGLLVERIGGPPVKPYQPAGLWREKSGATYTPDTGEGLWRRSLYTYWKRTSPPPSMMIFDAAKRDVCVARRRPTDSPLQQLVLWNDPQRVEAARALAETIVTSAEDDAARVARLFRVATSSAPDEEQLAIVLALLEDARTEYAGDREAALALLEVGASTRDEALDVVEVAAWTMVVHTLLASDGAVVLR